MPGPTFKYDVAFSLLARDEALGLEINDLLQPRIRTFIYPERQKELAGTDGEVTFGNVFSEEARLVVVLFRPDWGKSKWTRIEESAIKRRGFDHGYDFAKVVQLEEGSAATVPSWVSPAHIWIGLNTFGVHGAAAVIEERVKELGGEPHEETIQEHAERVERAIQFERRRQAFRGSEGLFVATEEAKKLASELDDVCKLIKSTSFKLGVVQTGTFQDVYVHGLTRALVYRWMPTGLPSLENAKLEVLLLSYMPNPRLAAFAERPKTVQSLRFHFDMLPGDVPAWVLTADPRRTFSTRELAEHLVKFYMDNGRKDG